MSQDNYDWEAYWETRHGAKFARMGEVSLSIFVDGDVATVEDIAAQDNYIDFSTDDGTVVTLGILPKRAFDKEKEELAKQ